MQRAIQDLAQLSDSDLFAEIATGIEHIVEGVTRLHSAALELTQSEQHYPARLLANLAEEEASKALILMDVVRCPIGKAGERARTLRYFYNHLAKGIYAEACSWGGINSFSEMIEAVELERQEYYLDGPNDTDWIFPNRIRQKREDDLYVNYLREDGDSGYRYWTAPGDKSANSLFPYLGASPVTRTAIALLTLNICHPAGLAEVARIWRPIELAPDFGIKELRELNLATLDSIDAVSIPAPKREEAQRSVYQLWPFPLYDLDLNVSRVDRGSLRKVQERWSPDW